jgi:hypothetical protein
MPAAHRVLVPPPPPARRRPPLEAGWAAGPTIQHSFRVGTLSFMSTNGSATRAAGE